MRSKLLKAAAVTPNPTRGARARRERPPRAQVEPIAIDLVRRHGPEIMAVARRHSRTPEDAEDAYQRGLEILLTKAPSTAPGHLLPWLKTVVKHEAFALHRARERAGQPTPPDRLAAANRASAPPEDHAERLERLQIGAEALARLKPHEMRCMLLLAEGHTYKQIQELTGFSYTKVNRCLTEGRRSFLRRVEGIESGEECARLAPLLSALADGEASAKDMTMLRPPLRPCLACRAALRDAREVPARVAALAPIGILAGGHASAAGGGPLAALRAGWDALTERLTSLALRGQELFETASSHKLAAAAASAAALGGGGIATVEVGGQETHRERERGAPTVVEEPRASAWRAAAVVRPARVGEQRRPTRTGHPRKRRALPLPPAQ